MENTCRQGRHHQGVRDRIQNHTLQDVGSKSYDRWNYMREKRAAMKKWDAFVTKLLMRKAFKRAA
jgi:hypothetical protein